MKKFAIALAMLLGACAPDPTDTMPAATSSNGRVTVERIGVIADDLAYDQRRGIYVITDTKTGDTFLGVSGVGVAELGSHNCGKSCTRDDER